MSENPTHWFVSKRDEQFGPFEPEEIRDLISQGAIAEDDLLWRSGWDGWRAFRELPAKEWTAEDRREKDGPLDVTVRFIRHGLGAPRRTLSTIHDLFADTKTFANARLDVQPKDLTKALLFYLSVFGFAFFLYTVIQYFSFYRGVEHTRELAFLGVQVAIGVAALYLLNKAVRRNVTLSGTLQAVLYIDGPFLLLFAVVRLAVAFVGYHTTLYGHEPDLIENEFENCVAHRSLVYSLLRGDMTFLLHSDDPAISKWVNIFDQYGELVLIIPFCFLFAKLMYHRYGTSILMNVVGGGLAYLLATTTFVRATDYVRNAEANLSGCRVSLNEILSIKYSSDALVRQSLIRINNRAATFRNVRENWIVRNKDGDVFVNINSVPDQATRTNLSNQFRDAFYCADDVDFILIRYLKANFAVVYRFPDGTPAYADVFKPENCSTKPGG